MRPLTSFPKLEVPPLGDLQSCPSAEPAPSPLEASSPLLSAALRPSALIGLARSVWFLPVLKIVGFCSALACIAWFGEQARDETIYGPTLAKPPSETPERTPPPAPEAAPLPPSPTPPPCAPAAPAEGPAAPRAAVLADGRLVLNEATAEDLDRLPGIGLKRAQDIVLLRTRLGRFKRLSDLLRVRGIGPRSLANLQEHLVLDRPSAPEASTSSQDDGKPKTPEKGSEPRPNPPPPDDRAGPAAS